MTELRILELFSGIGGMHYAFKRTGLPGLVVAAVDINNIANTVYAHNHPETLVLNNNIQRLNANEISKLEVNMILMSPPCQPFTRVGNRKDMDDSRTDGLKHICSLLPQCSGIKYILLENVKGFEASRARDNYVETLKSCGFYISEFILTPTQFSVPNTRHRYYCLARTKKPFSFVEEGKIMETLPLILNPPKQLIPIQQILENEDEIPTEAYLDENVLKKRICLMDIVGPNAINTNCFTKAYTRYSEGTGSVFTASHSSLVDKIFNQVKDVSPEGTAKRLVLLRSLRLRYFTPREVARLMSFPESFAFPQGISTRQKYRLLGNSINVIVVSELIMLIFAEI